MVRVILTVIVIVVTVWILYFQQVRYPRESFVRAYTAYSESSTYPDKCHKAVVAFILYDKLKSWQKADYVKAAIALDTTTRRCNDLYTR